MKFGIYSSIGNPVTRKGLDKHVDQVVEEAKLAEKVGFDSCVFGERHQEKDGFLPSPLILATTVAANTTSLRTGTMLILLPLHHPVQVAEDALTLDVISKGRLIIGVGLGASEADLQAFGVDRKVRVQRLEEGIEIIRSCWSAKKFSVSGEAYKLTDIQILPEPFQQSGPPIWIGANSQLGAKRAGRMGDAFVVDPSANLETSMEFIDAYRKEAISFNREPQVVVMRDSWVGRTAKEAVNDYGPALGKAYQYYWKKGLKAYQGIKSENEVSLASLGKNRAIVGSPEDCIKEYHRWHDATGADYFILRMRHAHGYGPSHDKIMESIKLFGESVIPNCT